LLTKVVIILSNAVRPLLFYATLTLTRKNFNKLKYIKSKYNMKKLLLPLLLIMVLSTSAQNVLNNNPVNNDDNNAPIALNTNNSGNLGNQADINAPENPQINPPINWEQQQVQVQAPVPQVQQVNQQAPANRGNFFNTGNGNPVNYNQQKAGQSIQPVAGGGGYSGSSGKAKLISHKHKSLELILKKAIKPNYKHPKHYAHKKRVKKCHTF
jgi:hypothetical protein